MSCFYSPPQSAFQCSRLGVDSLPGEDILASLRAKGAMSTKIPGETPWIDAWIRWERKSKEVYDCSADGVFWLESGVESSHTPVRAVTLF